MHTGLAPVLILWYCWGFRHNLVEKTVNECSFISVMWSWNAFVQPLIKRSCLCAAVSLFFSLCLLLNCATWQLETTHMLRILICFVCHLVFVCLRKEVSFVICCVHMQGFFFFFLVFTQSEAISSLLFCMVLMPISLYNLLISPERRNSSLFCFAPLFFCISRGLDWKVKKVSVCT